MQEPTQYVSAYTAPATLITQSCKVAKNTTDGWTKTLYSGGDPTQYASMDDLKNAILNGTGPSIWTPGVIKHSPLQHRIFAYAYGSAGWSMQAKV